MNGPALVCFAVPQEAKPFRKLIRGRDDVRVLSTGMGAANAGRAVAGALAQFSPACVFSCGFAGALDASLRVGDVVFDLERTSEQTATALIRLGAGPVKFHHAGRVVVTAAEKSALRARTNADAVEMESRVIHELCAARGFQCVTLRAISDAADEDLPLDFNVLMTSDQHLSSTRLASSILKAPNKIPALVRLGWNSACAARSLARVLASLLRS